MSPKIILELCRKIASGIGLDENLAVAICGQESNYVASVVRYEERWAYLVNPEKYAEALGITSATEIQLQKFSWGPMQVMGSVCRELGYTGHLTELIIPQTGLLYGCRKLQQLCKKYPDKSDAIASYNGGNPTKVNGRYKNNQYVEEVKKRLSLIQTI